MTNLSESKIINIFQTKLGNKKFSLSVLGKVASEISFKQKWHSKLEWSSSDASWNKGSNAKVDTKNKPTKTSK